jgi:hypothetical protein
VAVCRQYRFAFLEGVAERFVGNWIDGQWNRHFV